LPTKGLPLLLETCFEKAHGAPVAWGKPKRSSPTKRAGKDEKNMREEEAKCPHPHFHIFVSLPGLNGPVAKRRTCKFLIGRKTLTRPLEPLC